MTRIKKGLDYFCFTTDYFTDLKVKRLRRLCGNNGLLVCIYLVNEAYRVVGYALKVCEELILDIAENFRIEEVEVQNIIDACCKVGIFDAGIYRKCEVLTSAEIQERFVATCRKLGRRNVEIVKDLLLIEDKFVLPSEASQPSVNQTHKKSDEDGDIVKSENETAEICPQRKEKKGKETKREEKIPHPSIPSPEMGKGEESVRPVGTSAEEGGDTLRLPLDEVSEGGVPESVPSILPAPHTPCPRGEGRNYWGMVEALQRFRLPVRDINAILKMSNFGEIGDPAWRAIYDINNSGGGIKYPAKYIYSAIQKARKRQEGGLL